MPKAHNCKFDWNPAGGGGSKFACDSYNTLDHSCIRLIPLCIFAAFQRSALKTYGYRWRDDRKQISCVSHLSDDAIDFKIWLAGLYLFFWSMMSEQSTFMSTTAVDERRPANVRRTNRKPPSKSKCHRPFGNTRGIRPASRHHLGFYPFSTLVPS